MMIKIQFLLRKPNDKRESLEYITIDSPRIDKTRKFDWGSRYICKVYLSNIEPKDHLIYGISPINVLCLASEFAKICLQGLIKGGCSISEVENKEPWKLEKLSDNFIREKISEIKGSKSISQEDKDRILKGVDEIVS